MTSNWQTQADAHRHRSHEASDPFVEENRDVYYLAHHPVIKMESTTSKIRPVYDASTKTSSGTSSNVLEHTGRKLQDGQAQILLKWRKFQYDVSYDIEKVFRMVNVQPSHRNFQRAMPIQECVLTTVLFDETPAAFLAVWTLL